MPATDYTTLKNETLSLLADAVKVARPLDTAAAQRLEQTAERLAAERLTMVICGEFKRGKSSLINALLNESNLCPVGIDLTTAVVSSIAYSPVERITVVRGQPGEVPRTETISRAEIARYVSEAYNPGNREAVRLLAIETPNPKLESGLVVVDTPGVGGLVAEHSDVTYAFLPNADVVLFVGDVQSPLSTKELEFAALTGKFCRHLIHAVTKIDGDAGSNAKVVMASNRAKLAAALNRPENETLVIGLSSTAKQAYCVSKDPLALEDSNFPALEAAIWNRLGANRGAVLIEGALGRLAYTLGELRTPRVADLEALKADSKKAVDDLQSRWQSLSDRLTELQSGQAVWRTLLSDRLEDLSNHVRHELAAGFANLRSKMELGLNQDEYLAEPLRLIDRLQVDVNVLTARLTDHVRAGAAEIPTELSSATRLTFHAADVGEIAITQACIDGIVVTDRTSWWSKCLQMTSRAGIMATAGATLTSFLGGAVGGALGLFAGGAGAIPGAILGSQLGAALGGIGGFATGARNAAAQIRQQDHALARRDIQPILAKFLNDCERETGKQLTQAIKGLQRSLRDELVNQIEQERKVCDSTLATLAKARKLAPAETAKRIAAAKKELATLDGLATRVARLLSRIATAGRPNSTTPAVREEPVPLDSAEPARAFGGWADA